MAHALNDPLSLQLRLLQIAAWQGGDEYRLEALPLLEQAIADKNISERARLDYLLLQAEYLRRLGRFEQAQQSVDMVSAANPEIIQYLKSILQCQKQLIAEKNNRPSPVPGPTARCGDPVL